MASDSSSFTAALLASVHPGASPLQIAHDPDGMLLDEVALATLSDRGFAVETPEKLPWDILNAAKLHRMSLTDWFVGLDLAVVRVLPNHMLDRLYDQYVAKRPGALGTVRPSVRAGSG